MKFPLRNKALFIQIHRNGRPQASLSNGGGGEGAVGQVVVLELVVVLAAMEVGSLWSSCRSPSSTSSRRRSPGSTLRLRGWHHGCMDNLIAIGNDESWYDANIAKASLQI